MRRRYPAPVAALASRSPGVVLLCWPAAGWRRHALRDRRARLGPRGRDEPVRRPRICPGRLELSADPRALLPGNGAARSCPPGRCGCCSPKRRSCGPDQLDEAVQGRRRPWQGAQAESRHDRTSSRRSSAFCASPLRFVAGGAPLQLDGDGLSRRARSSTGRHGKLTIVNRCRSTATSAASCRGRCPTTGTARRSARSRSWPAPYAARDAQAGLPVRPLRRHAQPGLRRHSARRRSRRTVRSVRRRAAFSYWNGHVGDDLSPLDLAGRTVSNEERGRGRRPCRISSPSPIPYDGLSKLHRWGPFRWTPADVGAEARDGRRYATSSSPRAVGARDGSDDQGPQRRPDDARAGLPPRCSTSARRGSRCGSLNLEHAAGVHWRWREGRSS